MTAAAIAECQQRGWALVPIPPGQKGPVIPAWQTREFGPEDFPAGCNIGVILGPRSRELVDVDLDCPEGLELADICLPPTGAEFGRASKPRSHRFYIAEGAVFESFRDPLQTGKSTLLELRAESETGGVHQTLIPLSVTDGERREWHGEAIEPATIDAKILKSRAAWLAAACLVWRYLGESTARRPAPDFPALLWEFDRDLARPVYEWLGLPRAEAPQKYPRRRSEQDPLDLDLAEIVSAIQNNYDWKGWNDIGLAIFAASRDTGDGFVVFDDFSARSPKYDPYETAARWRAYERCPPSRTGIGKLARLAYEAGWRRGARNVAR